MLIRALWVFASPLLLGEPAFAASQTPMPPTKFFADYTPSFTTPTDPALQARLEAIDSGLRARYGMTTNQTAVGPLDLQRLSLALLHPDREEYAASVAKIGILLAYFQTHPEAATNLDSATRHELGLMANISNNEIAAKYSRLLGLKQIQQVLNEKLGDLAVTTSLLRLRSILKGTATWRNLPRRLTI
jgi:hypothetical protein